MRYASVCSGIEAPTVAWHPLGWKPVWFSEIEKFPNAVLKHHYPTVRNLGDMTKLHETETFKNESIELLIGGTPCQSFSVAGLRKGLSDPRGNLALTYLSLADRKRPRWIVWENVPGVLSSNGGRDFGAFLGALGQLGYGFAYRVLDAQYFGVAQRRRRVFVVGYLGDWRRAAAVLFEPQSLRGDPAPSRQTGEGFAAPTAPSLTASDSASPYVAPTLDKSKIPATALTLRAGAPNWGKGHGSRSGDKDDNLIVAHTLRAEGFDASEDGSGRGIPLVPTHTPRISHCLNAGGMGRQDYETEALIARSGVRHLTPVECERLQGFPDGYTAVPYRSKPAADGPRYKALGNSMAVPVIRWLGQRIQLVEDGKL